MRRKHETVHGARVSVWDEGPSVWDRYTVVYLDEEDERGYVEYLSMSEHPTRPDGFGQHGDMPVSRVCYRGRGGAFRKRITFAELPPDCQTAVREDLSA